MWCPVRPLALVAFAAGLAACSFGAPTAEGPLGDPAAVRTPVAYHADGTVEVDERVFESVAEFHRSDEFRGGERRCASEDVPSIAALDTGDCSFSRTRIQPAYAPGARVTIPVVSTS